jgi:Malectin domain
MAINVGGPAYSASNGITYIADRYFTGGDTTDWSWVGDVGSTNDDSIYLSERWGNFQYSIPMANGTYDVVLQFSELNWNGVGERKISAVIEGVTMLRDFDIFQSVGADSALDTSFGNIQVNDGALTIQMTASVDAGTLAGILVKRSSTSTISNVVPPSGVSAPAVNTDTQPPTAPSNITTSNVLKNQITLAWQASIDNVGVKSYRIFRGTQQVGSVDSPTLTYTDTNLTPDSAYTYTLKAVDSANNISLASASSSVKTPLVSGPVKLSWSRPNTRADGLTPLYSTDIGGYKIRYKVRGTSSFEMVKIPSSGLTDMNLISYTFSNLSTGDWDFEVACYVIDGSTEVDGEYAPAIF